MWVEGRVVLVFHTTKQLLQWLSEHIKIPAIVRALDEGVVQYYGWFEPEGFVILIKSRFGREWILGVKPVNFRQYQADILKTIPYEHYRGGSTELYSGDFPVLCMEERAKVRQANAVTRLP